MSRVKAKVLLWSTLEERGMKGLDYSDVIFASAKFRGTAKNKKTGAATCLIFGEKFGKFYQKREK